MTLVSKILFWGTSVTRRSCRWYNIHHEQRPTNSHSQKRE